MSENRQISIEGDAEGNVVVSGDGNRVLVVQLARPQEPEQPAPPSPIGPNPYLGLAAFTEQDAERFFGREALSTRLWEAFRALHEPPPGQSPPRLLPILGPSGSGKSSLARAGLIPELARRPLPALQAPRVAIATPGAHPLEALAAVLARIATGDQTPVAKTREFRGELSQENEQGEYDGLRRIAELLPDSARMPLIVLIDQFEELYSLCDDTDERNAFVSNLLHAAGDRAARVSVMLTLRSDFLGQTQRHPALNQAIAARGVLVPAMAADDLRRAITEPAKQAGQPLGPGVVDLLIGETEGREGALPLLQFALTRIWEGMAQGKAPADTLRDIGGVGGALAGEAQRLYEGLGDKDELIARRSFLAMVRLGEGVRDTRRRVGIEGIVAHGEDPEHVRAVLRRFAQPGARLITLAADTDGRDTAEITHEALFEHWALMEDWLAKGRDDLRFQRRLDEAAQHWDTQGRPPGSLWSRPDLDLLRGFYRRASSDMTALQIAFFRASERRERRGWRLRWGAVAALIALTVISGFAAFIANQESKRAERRFNDVRQIANAFIFEFDDAIKDLVGSTPARELLVREALRYLDSLAQESDDDPSLQRDLAAAYIKVGDVQVQLGDADGASESYQRTLLIVETLARQDPANAAWQRDLSVSHNKIGYILAAQGNLTEALGAYRYGLAIARTLTRQDPANAAWQRDLSVSHDRIGDILAAQGNLTDALGAFRDSLAISQTLARQDPANAAWQRDLSVSHERIGDILADQGNLTEALGAYRDSLAISQTLARQDPANAAWQRDLSVSHIKIGDSLADQGNLTEALGAYRDSLAIARTLARQDPANAAWQRDLFVSHNKIGDILAAQGNLTEALGAYRDSLAIARTLARQDPANAGWQRDLSVSHDRIGDSLADQGNLTEALGAFRDSLAIRQTLARQDPANAGWQTDLVVSYWKIASALPDEPAARAEARAYLEQGLAILKRLHDESRLTHEQLGWIDLLETELQKEE